MSDDQSQQAANRHADLAYPLNSDSPFAAPFLDRGLQTAFHFVDVTGLAKRTIDALIPTVLLEMEERELIPVFIADFGEFDAFRRHEVIFEALPDIAAGYDTLPTLDFAARRAECLALLEAKWKPQGTTILKEQATASE